VAVRVATVALALLAATAAGAAPQPSTVVHETVWFRGAEPAPDLRITEDVAGHCASSARSTPRADGWRCFADEHWIDPCFSATSRSRRVLCPLDPWSKSVRLVELTRRLPPVTKRPLRTYAPWGVWTANAKRCVIAVSGAKLLLDGRRVRYECAVSGFLVGYADTRGSQWTIGYVPRFALANPRRLHSRRIGITDVWR
jgi:hypothetical protein